MRCWCFLTGADASALSEAQSNYAALSMQQSDVRNSHASGLWVCKVNSGGPLHGSDCSTFPVMSFCCCQACYSSHVGLMLGSASCSSGGSIAPCLATEVLTSPGCVSTHMLLQHGTHTLFQTQRLWVQRRSFEPSMNTPRRADT